MFATDANGAVLTSIDSKTSQLSRYKSLDEFFPYTKLSEKKISAIKSDVNASKIGSAKLSLSGKEQFMVYLPVGINGLCAFYLLDFAVIRTDAFSVATSLMLLLSSIVIVAIIMIFSLSKKDSSAMSTLETELKQLELSKKEFEIAADHNNQMIFRFYPDGDSVQLPEEFSALQGLPRVLKNSPEASVKSGLISSESAEDYLNFFRSIRHNEPSSKCELKCDFSTGDAWYDMDYTMLHNASGKPYAVISAVDVTQRKLAQQEMLRQSREDPLTGALNRKAFKETATDILTAQKDKKHCVIMFDLDSFKHINDTYGHIMGDNVLFDTSERLRAVLHEKDLLGRLGGDEFMMFLQDIDTDQPAILNARLQEMVDVVHRSIKGKTNVTASIGASIYPQDSKAFDELYRTADLAVYSAKANGCDRFELYSKKLENNPLKQKPQLDNTK